MHTANNLGDATLHPVFVRKVVQAVKDGGGRPFVADVSWDPVGAEMSGYSSEVLGSPSAIGRLQGPPVGPRPGPNRFSDASAPISARALPRA